MADLILADSPVMVVPQVAKQVIQKMGTWEWKSQQEKFRKNIEKTRAFALGDIEEIMSFVPLNPGESVAGFKSKTKGYRGLVQKIMQAYLDGISGLPVSREVPNFPDFDLSLFEQNLDLQKIQMKAEMGGTVAVRPFINMNGGISYEAFDAWQLCPMTQGEDLVALGIKYGEKSDSFVEVWTPFSMTIYRGKSLVFTDINPYGLIPFSIFRAALNDKEWFGVSDLTSSVNNNISVIKMLTDLQQLARDQSYSWLVFRGEQGDKSDDPSGISAEGKMVVAPDRMTMIGPNDDLFTVTPDASINEIQAAADLLAEKTYEDACVSSVVQSAQVESGYALKVKRAPYLNKMRSKRNLFIEADQRLMQIAALVQEVWESGLAATLSEDFSISTNFDDSQLTPEDPASQMTRETFLLDKKVISRIDLIMSEYQVGRDEAEEIANRIDEESGTSAGGTEVGFNELSLGAQRLGSVGDVDGYNILRQESLAAVGATDVAPVEKLARPAPDTNE